MRLAVQHESLDNIKGIDSALLSEKAETEWHKAKILTSFQMLAFVFYSLSMGPFTELIWNPPGPSDGELMRSIPVPMAVPIKATQHHLRIWSAEYSEKEIGK